MTSFLAIVCFLIRHCYRVKWLQTYFTQNEDSVFSYYNQIITSNMQSLASAGSFLSNSHHTSANSYFSGFLCFEILLMCIFPWPFFDTYILFNYVDESNNLDIVAEYLISDFFLAVMFIRVLFLYRSLLNYSLYTDAVTKQLCNQYGFTNSHKFALKCLFNIYPGTLVGSTMILTILVGGYLLRIFELPLLKHMSASYYTLD